MNVGVALAAGSTRRTANVSVVEKVQVTDHLFYKAKHRDGGKKVVRAVSGGESYYSTTGKWNVMYRLIDRANNWYHEIIKDGQTGEVVHENSEPLSEHRGHGSAKLGRPDRLNSINMLRRRTDASRAQVPCFEEMNMSRERRVAVITGASQGMGAALVAVYRTWPTAREAGRSISKDCRISSGGMLQSGEMRVIYD